MLLQDSWYDQYRGAILLVQVVSGTLRSGDTVTSCHTGKSYSVRTLGVLAPEEVPVQAVYPGQVACFSCNLRQSNDAVVGDTFHLKDRPAPPVAVDLTPPTPMVFAGFFPFDNDDQARLKGAVERVEFE